MPEEASTPEAPSVPWVKLMEGGAVETVTYPFVYVTEPPDGAVVSLANANPVVPLLPATSFPVIVWLAGFEGEPVQL